VTIDLKNPVASSEVRERALARVQELAASANPVVRANAMEAAGLVPNRCVEVLRRGLSDSSPAVRSVAAMAAGRAGVTAVLPQVRPLVDDAAPSVRLSARFALSKLGEPVDLTPLGRALMTSETVGGRSHAAFLLGELGNSSALGLLREAASERTRGASAADQKLFTLQVAEAMIKLGDGAQRQVVRAALYPARPEELEAAALAAQILGQVNDTESAKQLVHLSEYRDSSGRAYPSEVRLAIARSLGMMGVRGGEFIADEHAASPDPLLRGLSAMVYGAFRTPRAMGRLSAMLDDPAEEVRVAAAHAVLTATERRR
jgi:HEAT repeat protein